MPSRSDLRLKLGLFFIVGILPLLVSGTALEVSFDRAKEVEFCASCHVMHPFTDDLLDAGSDTLSSKHFQNRWISENQCYACHADYDFFGPVKLKIRGMRHTAAYYLGDNEKRPKLYRPFPNQNCLRCHDGGKSFLAQPLHGEIRPRLDSGETRCIDCHGPAHKGMGGA